MKKEWGLQLIVLLIFYLDSIIEVDHDGILISDTLGIDFLFLMFHAMLFFLVNYLLIPKLFYRKKYVLFGLSLLGAIILFGILEEGVVERILTPNSRGQNPINWQSIYWFFGEILVPLLSFMSIKFMFDNFKHQQKLEQIEKDNLTNELKFLKSQIQPHILFNSLNNLYHFTLSKSEKAPDLVLKLSNVLRYILYETAGQKVTLQKELTFVEDYVDLQKMQFEGRGIIKFNQKISGSIEDFKIAPFLLIPFIENSVKHSLGSKDEDVSVAIDLRIDKGELQLLVENNYEEMAASKEDLMYKGIGLKNVQKRLKLLYPNQHQLQIRQQENLYCVQLDLTLI